MAVFEPLITGEGALTAAIRPENEGLIPLCRYIGSLCDGINRLYYDLLLFSSIQAHRLDVVRSIGFEVPGADERARRAAQDHYALVVARDYVLASYSIVYLSQQFLRPEVEVFKDESPPRICIERFLENVRQSYPKLKNLRDAVAHAMEFPEKLEKHSLGRSRRRDRWVIEGGGQILISDGLDQGGYFATYKGEHIRMPIDRQSLDCFASFYSEFGKAIY
jgi:hypothetical protein